MMPPDMSRTYIGRDAFRHDGAAGTRAAKRAFRNRMEHPSTEGPEMILYGQTWPSAKCWAVLLRRSSARRRDSSPSEAQMLVQSSRGER